MNFAFLRFAMRGLTRRPVPTLLVLFALTVALACTMTLRAVLAGIEEQVENDLKRVGLDIINIHVSPSMENMFQSPLHLGHCARFEEITGGEAAPFRVTLGVATSIENTNPTRSIVLAVPPGWNRMVPLEWLEGGFFKEGDRDSCVLDEWVAKHLSPQDSLVGKEIRLIYEGKTRDVTVKGVMKDPFEIRSQFDEFDFVGSARSRMLGMMEFKSIYVLNTQQDPDSPIHGAIVKIPKGKDPSLLEDKLIEEFSTLGDSIWIWARISWVSQVLRATNIGTSIAQAVGFIVLIVVGVMVTTISLVAIRERYREIAIRRTEGGLRLEIIGQLLTENVILSGTAGIIAILASRLAGTIIEARYISWTPAHKPEDIFIVLGLGLLLGAFATILPAYRASSLDPVEVLRLE